MKFGLDSHSTHSNRLVESFKSTIIIKHEKSSYVMPVLCLLLDACTPRPKKGAWIENPLALNVRRLHQNKRMFVLVKKRYFKYDILIFEKSKV